MPAEPVPSRWWGRPLAETRWTLELARLLVDPVMLGAGVPRGNGRPVILMPGFLAGDQTLALIAAWLRVIGYRPHVAGFAANVDCADRAAERVERRVDAPHRSSGHRVALVGHSRGGHYARAVAARAPDRVSHAVSLGADLREMLSISVPTTAAVSLARHGLTATCRARAELCMTPECTCAFAEDFRPTVHTDALEAVAKVWPRLGSPLVWGVSREPPLRHFLTTESRVAHPGGARRGPARPFVGGRRGSWSNFEE